MKSKRADSGTAAGERGFTMIELLVVLVILGLAATAVVVAVPGPEGRLAAEAERFAARAKAARDSALIESRPVAINIGQGGYGIDRRVDGAWRTEARYEWSESTDPELAGSEEKRVVFDPTGLVEPLYLTLRRGDERADVEIAHDGAIAVRR